METIYYKYRLKSVLNISSLCSVSYQILDKDYFFKGESHPAWEFIYVDKNTVNITVADELYTLNNKEIFFIAPYLWHTVECNNEDDANIFVVSFHFNSKFQDFFFNKKIQLKNEPITLLEKIISRANNIFDFNDKHLFETKLIPIANHLEGDEQLLQNYLEIFMIQLFQQSRSKTSVVLEKEEEEKNNNSVNVAYEISAFLKRNLYNKITLQDICDNLHYGKSYISKNFKETYYITIMDYYTKLKIEESKKHLKFGTLSIKELSESLHFSSDSHFINTFKKFEKISPKAYAKSIRAKFNNS